MQRATTATTPTMPATRAEAEPTCPVCGDPIAGIAAERPGEHRFVGCGHYASARFLREPPASAGPHASRYRLGP